jgi:hypothetical protein
VEVTGNSEITQFEFTITGQEQITWLEVTVDDSLGVGMCHGKGCIPNHLNPTE